MTDQNQSHPIPGSRRRRKSPASLPAAQHMPLPRLLDHLDAADGPSDEEEEKFQDVEEVTTKETDTGDKTESEARGPGEIHGRFGSTTLRECNERISQCRTAAPATLHWGRN